MASYEYASQNAKEDDNGPVDYSNTSIGTVTESAATYSPASIMTSGTTSTYRPPEPALIEMAKQEMEPTKGKKVCMCCKEKKFGLFSGKCVFSISQPEYRRINCKACGMVVYL